jgi:magnesium-transporting ATPase (P-type)
VTRFGQIYRTPSPDEVALAKYAGSCGFKFVKRVGDMLTLDEMGTSLFLLLRPMRPLYCHQNRVSDTGAPSGTEKHYKLLALCDFTSKRRRMTVLVRHMDTGRVQALVKGADSMVFSLLSKDSAPETQSIISDRLREFSKCVLAYFCLR